MNYIIFLLTFIAGAAAVFIFFKMKNSKAMQEEVDDFQKTVLQKETIPTEEKKLNDDKSEKLQKELNNLFLVNELSQRITSSLSIEESFSHLYNTINSMMDASVVELVVYADQNENRLFFSNKSYPETNLKLPFYNHFAEWCFKNNREIFLEDAELDYGRYVFQPLTMPDGKIAKSVMTFTIMHQQKITGTLCIISFTKNAFELFHKEMIRLLLPFVGVAINNAFNHQQIINLKQRAERSEQFMQQFLANMSHEIRTPMNSVMGMTNLLLQKNPLKEQLKYLNTIQKSSENLLVILNDILDLSKIEAGKIVLEQIDFSIREVINNVKEILQHKSDEKQLQFNVDVDENIPDVLIGDPTRLTQILINLVGNAIKFTDRGSISLNVIANEERVKQSHSNGKIASCLAMTFNIIDTGIGMTLAQQQKLFEKFSQASGDTTRKYGGTGLGLNITKQLIELQGGRISVESQLGKGTKFSFEINYAISKNELKTELKNSSDMFDELHGIKILLAEDNEFNRMVAVETLQLKIPDVKIIEATNGLEALDVLRNNSPLWGVGGPDLILMDVNMPVMDGLTAIRKIREEFPSPANQIKILSFTASVIKSEIDKCYEAGADGFIPKPFKPDELYRTIHKTLFGDASIINTELTGTKNGKAFSDKLIDLNYLYEYTEGDKNRMERYVNQFIEKIPSSILILEKAIAENHYETIRIAVHSMKPQLRIMGLQQGLQLAEHIEENIRMNSDLMHLPQLVNQLIVICETATEELKRR